MLRPFPDLHLEGVVCALRGHLFPAKNYQYLDQSHSALGIELQQDHRLLRCIRCDSWQEIQVNRQERQETPRNLQELEIPRQGKVLKQFIVLRLIALDKLLHGVLFAAILLVAVVLDRNLGGLHHQAESLYRMLQDSQSADTPGRDFMSSGIRGLLRLNHQTLQTVILLSGAYMVLEGVESWGLWHEKRWAEYLTAIATAGLLPLEIHEIMIKVTPLRIGALAINLLILGWLLWAKRLFGLNGGHEAMTWLEEESPLDLRPLQFK